MTNERAPRFLVRCDGAPAPDVWRSEIGTETIHVDLDPTISSATNLVIRGLTNTVLADLGPRSDDFIRIMASAFRGDECAPRSREGDVHGERWTREFGLCAYVSDLDFWSQPAVHAALASALRFGADDVWRFSFSRLPKRLSRFVQTKLELSASAAAGNPGCVVLFSGGIDSLAILVEAAVNGERPLAVSHWAAPAIRGRQTDLLSQLAVPSASAQTGRWTFPSLGVEIHGLGDEARERTRRTRSVLFACLGAVAAGELGIDRVYLGDNGPISLNLPINDQLVGARASRSTHPVLLQRVSVLAELIYERPIRFSNPLWARTRAEAIETLKDAGLANLLAGTLSCANWGWGNGTSLKPHCGYCSQCIDRRFATIAAGVEALDPPTRYGRDVFLAPSPSRKAGLLALSYVRFAQRVSGMTDVDLISRFPALAEAVLPDDPDPAGTMRELIDLTRRHAATVLRVMDLQREAARTVIAQGKLAPNALLALSAVDPGLNAEVVTRADEPAVPDKIGSMRPDVRDGETGSLVYAGTFWELTYDRTTIQLAGGEGVARLAYLLAHPGKSFPPWELLARTGAIVPPTGEPVVDEDNLHEVNGAKNDPIYDPVSLGKLSRSLRALEQEIAAARAAGDEALAAHKEAERARVHAFRNQGTRPGKQLKHFGDLHSKQYDAVYRSFHRLLQTLQKRHPELHAHLKATLKYGHTNRYAPEPEQPPWRVAISSQAA